MEIDHSGASAFRTCPLLYFEQYLKEGTGLELKNLDGRIGPYDVGTRVHQLQEEYYNELRGTPIAPYPRYPNEKVELEAQMIIAAYKLKYSVEEHEIVDVERSFRIALPHFCIHCYSTNTHFWVPGIRVCEDCRHQFPERNHIYTGKIDVTFRAEKLDIMDHKSERRRSSSNHPKRWAARDQASLYLWAASKIYPGEEIGNFYVNVLTRPSDKLQEGPIFPERQKLERTPEQIEIAVRDIVITADAIERHKQVFGNNLWPANREECTEGTWGDCEFYQPHVYGWSDEIRKLKYQPKEQYLHLAGIPIIQ